VGVGGGGGGGDERPVRLKDGVGPIRIDVLVRSVAPTHDTGFNVAKHEHRKGDHRLLEVREPVSVGVCVGGCVCVGQ
jgi:hypothetical protein